jgi:DNA mismatch repair protein MSH2
MARRKADELEDFSSAHEGGETAGKAVAYEKEDVEQGGVLLKEILGQWKKQVDAQGGRDMETKEKVALLREMVNGDNRLMGNKFFESVRAL